MSNSPPDEAAQSGEDGTPTDNASTPDTDEQRKWLKDVLNVDTGQSANIDAAAANAAAPMDATTTASDADGVSGPLPPDTIAASAADVTQDGNTGPATSGEQPDVASVGSVSSLGTPSDGDTDTQSAAAITPTDGDGATPNMAQALPIAGGVAVEVAIVAFLALIAALVLIANAPRLGRELEELLGKIQVAMAAMADKISEAADAVEDLIRNNTQAGMRCSDQVIAFRTLTKQLLDALKQPRDPDPIKQQQNVIRISNLAKQWQKAFAAVLDCLGVPLG